ncbi:MAG: PKD domain-containing protein [Limisphaerales bacterium]
MIKQLLKSAVLGIGLHAFHAAATTYYVNANSSNPTPPYASWSTAATDIQSAIDAASVGDLVLVTDGVYQVGGETINGYAMTNRVLINKPVTVESVNGPANTIIEGSQYAVATAYSAQFGEQPFIGNPYGFGTVRCVCITTNAALIGFTLTDGATLYEPPQTADGEGGGVWCVSTNTDVISNCVLVANAAYSQGGGAFQGTLLGCGILNNWAMNGGGAANAAIFRCLLISNTASGTAYGPNGSGGGAFNCSVFDSAFAQNSATYEGGGADGGTLVNCTITENTATERGGGTANCNPTNCIIYYNKIFLNSTYETNCYGNAFYCCTIPKQPGDITNEPELADYAHISLNSPCRGAGTPVAANGGDIDGQPWNNPPSIGCSEIPLAGDYGNLIVNISTPLTNWAPNYPLNFQATISGPDEMTFWNFGDGTMMTNEPFLVHTWAAPGAYPVTLTAFNDSYPTGVTATVMINITVPKTNYVNWASQNPVPPYLSWGMAATNIQDAVNAAAPG